MSDTPDFWRREYQYYPQQGGVSRENRHILNTFAVLCPVELAKELKKDLLIKIIGSGHATDFTALHSKEDITWPAAKAKAAERAYKMAGKTPVHIDFVEVYDCFTIAEICLTEGLGFFEKGQGGKAVEKGLTLLEGKIPVNTSGGLKSKGPDSQNRT